MVAPAGATSTTPWVAAPRNSASPTTARASQRRSASFGTARPCANRPSTHRASHTWSPSPGTTAACTPLRFPGQYYDPETGLHYNLFRHYDPPYNPDFKHYDEGWLTAQADKLLALDEDLGGKGVRYMVSNEWSCRACERSAVQDPPRGLRQRAAEGVSRAWQRMSGMSSWLK